MPDGVTLNTNAIAKAIAACTNAGGGRVLVPAGRLLTGAIHLGPMSSPRQRGRHAAIQHQPGE